MQSGSSEPYRVRRSAAFYAALDAGAAAGWLDPVAHRPILDFYANVTLPRIPFLGEPVPDAAANVRVIRFPHTPRSLTFIELYYSLIVDDRTVTLEDIRLLPGVDYEG